MASGLSSIQFTKDDLAIYFTAKENGLVNGLEKEENLECPPASCAAAVSQVKASTGRLSTSLGVPMKVQEHRNNQY
jgi:hypothetical protein